MTHVIPEHDVILLIDKYDCLTSDNVAFVQSLCPYKDIINWENIIKLLKNTSSINLKQKVKMFLNVVNSENSNTISLNNISHLALSTMNTIINQNNHPHLVTELVNYFTKLLFTSLQEEHKQEIQLDKIE